MYSVCVQITTEFATLTHCGELGICELVVLGTWSFTKQWEQWQRGRKKVVLMQWSLITRQNFGQEALGIHPQTKSHALRCTSVSPRYPFTYCRDAVLQGLISQDRAASLLWACDRAELHGGSRERTGRGARKWWQRNLACQSPICCAVEAGMQWQETAGG